MTTLRAAGLAIALTASVGAPAQANHPKCSGVAPAITRCEVAIDHLSSWDSQGLAGYAIFSGTITATIETATGSWSFWCTTSDDVPPQHEGCGQSKIGTLASSGKLIGTAEGRGPWLVMVSDPYSCDVGLGHTLTWLHCYGPV